MSQLWEDAAAIRQKHRLKESFRNYISADYEQVFETLAPLRGQRFTLLEWGSGLGVVAIMASRMGFESYGIEIESELLDHADLLADKYEAEAQFFHGSFVPEDYQYNFEEGDEVFRTLTDAPSAYGEMDLALRDFDMVYAYPWPDEHLFYQNILRQFGNPNAILVTYDGSEGVQVTEVDRESEWE